MAALAIAVLLSGGACSTSMDPGAASPDPGGNGPYTVFQQAETVPGYTSRATLYAPSRDGGHSRVTDQKFPLVIVLPGFGASYTMYEHFILHMASC